MADFAAALESLLRDAKSADIPTRIMPRGGLRRLGVLGGAAALLILLVAGARWAIGSPRPPADQAAPTTESLESGGEPIAAGLTETAQPTPLPPTETRAARQTIELALYDDFETQGELNLLRWWDETDFRVSGGVAVLHAVKGETATYRAHLAAVRSWIPSRSGGVRFAVEARIRVDPVVFGAFGPGVVQFEVTGPEMSPGVTWLFVIGYSFESGFMTYECAGNRWDSSEPPPMYSETFGTPIFGEWHTFRASVEETTNQDELAYVGYVDGQAGCAWTPPDEWQEEIRRGGELSFFLEPGWHGEWGLDEPFRAYYDDVRVGTGY
jgi:uncharacterized cupin superfamily protein